MSVNSAEFADRIGVQRSAVSHILNGRNYPSAVVLEKMLKAYPNLNARWLITGDGSMVVVPGSSAPPSLDPLAAAAKSPTLPEADRANSLQPGTSAPEAPPFLPGGIALGGDIEQIVVFYSDNSFRAFSPKPTPALRPR